MNRTERAAVSETLVYFSTVLHFDVFLSPISSSPIIAQLISFFLVLSVPLLVWSLGWQACHAVFYLSLHHIIVPQVNLATPTTPN